MHVQRPVHMHCRFGILMRICLAVYMFLEICVRVEFQLRVWERMAQECFLGKGVRVCHIDDVDGVDSAFDDEEENFTVGDD